MRIAYHLTDDADFQLDGERPVIGNPDGTGTRYMTGVVYVTETPELWARGVWTGGRGYVATIEWDPTGHEHEVVYPNGKHEVLVDTARARVLSVSRSA